MFDRSFDPPDLDCGCINGECSPCPVGPPRRSCECDHTSDDEDTSTTPGTGGDRG